jgi:HAD superfamily 5'-nucleotidase-like hydrolase
VKPATSFGPERQIFVNRTLNLRSIKAIGYDMDYTLVHYDVAAWEERAFLHARERLAALGWPVGELAFDSSSVIRGLAIDLEEGNLVKATRFGYVIRASHGTTVLEFDEMRSAYAGTFVDLSEDRFVFINVLFSLSEASLFAQLVDLYDAGSIPRSIGYRGLHEAVRSALDDAHRDGDIQADILSDPGRFIARDEDTVLALLDQHHAGRRLMLITNAAWPYTRQTMEYAFDPYLSGRSWRELFETVIVAADKPSFFTGDRPLYKVIDEEQALLRPHHGDLKPGSVFFGGSATRVEASLGLTGDEILYVGDHLFGDVHFSKALLRWRTALILRELESEVAALTDFRANELRLVELMRTKEDLETELATLRLARQRATTGYGPDGTPPAEHAIADARARIADIDEEITPLAIAAGKLRNEAWGPLMRAGIDKSLFARQVERYADVYTSRVANLLHPGPYGLLRARKIDLPHDAAVWASAPHLPHPP